MEFLIIGTLVLVLIIGAAILLFWKRNITEKENERTGKYPEGHYMSIGIAIGIPLGLPIGLAMGNIALGPAFGAGIGVAIGAALEQKYKHKLRPLTKVEKENKKKTILLLVGALVVGLLVAVAAFFLV